MKDNKYHALEESLGYAFASHHRLDAALTHRSYRYENDDSDDDNQRLEFLGDAVLGLVAAAYLFQLFPKMQEGSLTHLRSSITNSHALTRIARQIGLGAYLRLSIGEKQSGGAERASNLRDAMEAIIGAAYLDGGMKAARLIFDRLFIPELQHVLDDVAASNPKGTLQEFAQHRWKQSPRYQIVHEEGPPHAKKYRAVVSINGQDFAEGEGTNKHQAEVAAARQALRIINDDPDIKLQLS
jgi:ribonuclease-3